MSARTAFNPARVLSRSTLAAIRAAGVDLDEYAANIESALRARGEYDLASQMLDEIEQSRAEDAANRDEEKRQRDLDRVMGRADY